MRTPLSRSALAVLVLSVAACGEPVDGEPAPAAADGGVLQAPPIEWAECALVPRQDAGTAECALVAAPREHAKPDSGTLQLAVKRLVQAPEPKAQLWLVDGGPGGSAVNAFAGLARKIRLLRPEIELYAVDHRGVGGSHPLECPLEESEDSEAGKAISADEWPSCVEWLRKREVNFLPHLSTTESMRDLAMLVERVRKPGVPVYVYGGSYGTYAVLRYLALFPEQPSAVILEGISPPGRNFDPYDAEMDQAARGLFEVCEGDSTCAARLGQDPWRTVGEVVASFDQGHCASINVDSDGARAFLASYLFYAPLRDFLPVLVHRMKRCEPRDVAAVARFYRVLSGGLDSSGPGLAVNDGKRDTMPAFFHVALSEMWHWEGLPDPAQVLADWRATTLSTGLTVRLAARQADWPVYPRGPEVTTALPAYSGPLLMLQGGLDAATPLHRAAVLREHFQGPGQHWVEFPHGSHQIVEGTALRGGEDCGRRILLQFLDDPAAPLDTGCVAQIPPINFSGYPALNRYLLGVDDAWDG